MENTTSTEHFQMPFFNFELVKILLAPFVATSTKKSLFPFMHSHFYFDKIVSKRFIENREKKVT